MSAMGYIPVGELSDRERAVFLSTVYRRLVLAVALFAGGQWLMFSSGFAYSWTSSVMSSSWLLILGGFMVVSWLSNRVLWGATSPSGQWAGLGALVAANVLIFSPMLVVAEIYAPGAIADAAVYALVGFVTLSVVAVRSSRDFLWFRVWLQWAGLSALALIVVAVLFGLSLGDWFSVAMIGLASASILFETQSMLRQMPPGRETAVAASLFSSLALLFWYVLRLVMSRR